MYAPVDTIPGSRSGVDQDPAEQHIELIRRVSAYQDKQAFQELFLFYAPRIKAFMLKQKADAELAEDLMQETMLTVWNKAGQFASWRGSLATWIFTIARNKRIDRFRRQGTRHYVDVDELEFADDSPDGEDRMLAGERDRLVGEAARKLPDDQKEVIRLAFAEELSQSEIAARLGLPLGTVKSRMRLAYQRIRKELEDVL